MQTNNNYQDEGDKARRKKIIVTSVAAGALVLLLGVGIVGTAMNSVKKDNITDLTAPSTSETTEDKKVTSINDPNAGTANAGTTISAGVPSAGVPVATTPVASVDTVPETGASDIALTALLMGAATFLALNLVMNKQKAEANA